MLLACISAPQLIAQDGSAPIESTGIEARVGLAPVEAIGNGRFSVARGVVLRYIQLEEAQADWHAYADILIEQIDTLVDMSETTSVEASLWKGAHSECVVSAERIAEESAYWQQTAVRAERARRVQTFFYGAGGIVLLGVTSAIVLSSL
ncbi:MAG: hypothetical protein AAFQ53_13225 [Bacteroidota bacterium]